MSLLTYRSDTVFSESATGTLSLPAGSVTAFAPGGVVASNSSGTTITLYGGHGFSANDKFMVGTTLSTFSGTIKVNSVSGNVLTLNSAYTVVANDVLVNLGPDTSTVNPPNFDASTVVIYSTPDTTTAITSPVKSKVTLDSVGSYEYWHKGIAVWEVVRNGAGTPVNIVKDATQAISAELNVKAFGATGDGTTDDTVAIQAALTAIPAAGGKVYIPAGTYITSTTLYIKSATWLAGDGIGVTIIKRKAATQTPSTTTLNAPIISAGPSVGTIYSSGTSGSKITITDLTLNSDYTNQTRITASGGTNNLRFAYVNGLTLQRIESLNTLETGIEVTFSNNVLIDSCIISAAGKLAAVADANGIGVYYGHATAWGQNVIISHNRITDIGVSGAYASEGIATYDLDFVTISDNEIGNIINGAGIELNITTLLTCVGYKVTDNNIHDCTGTFGFGIAAGIAGNIVSADISHNTISNVKFNGLYISRVSALTVNDNVVYNSNTTFNATYFNAIDILTSTAPNVHDNMVYFVTPDAGVYGIRGFTCTSGRFCENTVNTPTVGCIALNVSSQNNLISNNRLIAGTHGVQIFASGTNSGNTVINNYPTGQSTAAYADTSGQTNYVDSWTLGSYTVPTNLTVAGLINFSKTTGVQQIQSNTVYLNDGTDRDTTLFFNTSTSDGAITYKGGSATNLFEFNKGQRQITDNTALFSVSQISELMTLSTSGATTDSSANLLPVGSLLLGVVARVTTTITTATDWKLGDATTAARFCPAQSGAQLTAGATIVGLDHLSGAVSTLATGPSQAAAAKLRITTTGTPGAGVIRVTVFFLSFTAPGS